jgi:hypothetical protein
MRGQVLIIKAFPYMGAHNSLNLYAYYMPTTYHPAPTATYPQVPCLADTYVGTDVPEFILQLTCLGTVTYARSISGSILKARL